MCFVWHFFTSQSKALFFPVGAFVDSCPENLFNQELWIGAVDSDGIPHCLVVHCLGVLVRKRNVCSKVDLPGYTCIGSVHDP